MDRCIIHYGSISRANTLRELTVTTLSTLQNCKATRENLRRDNLHHRQGDGIPEDLDKQFYYHSECFKKYVLLSPLQKGKKIRMHENRRDQKGKRVLMKEDFSVIIV